MPSMQHARKSTGDGLMRNISSPHEEKYQTWDGNVTVTNFKRGLWSVHPRGYAPFMVRSKSEAFDQALGLSAKAGTHTSKASGSRHATKAKTRTAAGREAATHVPSGDKITIDQLAKLFNLPDWDRIDEMNQQNYWEMAKGADDEEAAEQAAQTEVYNRWYDAVESTAEKLLAEHGLELLAMKHTRKVHANYRPHALKIIPTKSWDDAANRLRETINGVGDFHFDTLREFLDSGPYTARQAVLSHLGYIKRYPAVYGGLGANQMYEQAWR